MMTGQLYIDGKDIYTDFGLCVTGGYNDVVAFPPLKSVKSNEWQEEDGVEADLSSPVLNTRDISLKFVVWGSNKDGLGALIDLLSDKAYHTFYSASLRRKFRLRLVSHPNLEWATRLGFTTLKFADDFPLDGYKYQPPVSNIASFGDYAIDDKLLTDYGVRVLKGTLASIDKSPEVKKNLLRNIKTQSGAMYDDARVTYKSKEVTINCLMQADSIEAFWRNHDALLYDLIRPDERRLFVDARGVEYPCYYKSCKTTEFANEGRVWWKFSLTLVFTSYRLKGKRPALRFVSDGVLRLMSNGNFRLT